MKSVVGGLIAIILGIFFLVLFFSKFITFLTGIIPLALIIGGGLILYIKQGETATDTWDNSNLTESDSPAAPPETSPAETQPVEIQPVETEPVETEPVETEPVETEPVETEPVETEPVETEPVEKPADTPAPQLFGNTESLVFHTTDCRYSTNKRCTAVFNTREDAIQEGYKPCGACKP